MTEKAKVCNVGDQEWTLVRTHGVYTIPAPKPEESIASLTVTDRVDVIDMGDNRRIEVPIPARKIAEDLASDLTDFGVFVPSGDEPTEQESANAKRHLVDVAKRLVFEADQEWARSHNYRLLSDLHRRAAKLLKQDREWSYEPTPMSECPACGERIKPGVAICKSCRTVLDREAAKSFLTVGEPEGASLGA